MCYLEKSLEQYREVVELRDKKIADAKKNLLSVKQSYDKLSHENRELKKYVAKIQQENQLRQQQLLARNKTRNYRLYSKRRAKKKVIQNLNRSTTLQKTQ